LKNKIGLTEPMLHRLRNRPNAVAQMHGSQAYPEIQGTVSFYETRIGVLVVADISGLPKGQNGCEVNVFGMHIHEGNNCTGNEKDAFADAKGHFNPDGCPHPQHAGDLPPLFGNSGFAWSAVLSDRFQLIDVLGRAVVIHRNPDDFVTQPSGNSGEKIACGIILQQT